METNPINTERNLSEGKIKGVRTTMIFTLIIQYLPLCRLSKKSCNYTRAQIQFTSL